MPGRQPENWGIPLWEAIERWTPRELWERYRKLAEYDIPLIIPGAEDPRSDEVRRLHSGITEFLVNRLARGELIASGIAVPLKETSRRRDIRPELWPRLGFNPGFQMVTGDGLRYDQILIREASSVRHEVPASRPQVSPRRAPARPRPVLDHADDRSRDAAPRCSRPDRGVVGPGGGSARDVGTTTVCGCACSQAGKHPEEAWTGLERTETDKKTR